MSAVRWTQALSVKFLLGHMEEASNKSMSEIGAYLLPLYALALQSNGHVVELGIGNGVSTSALFLGASDGGRVLTSYDIRHYGGHLPNGAVAGATFSKLSAHPKFSSWRFHQKPGKDGALDFEDESVGLLFDDASHNYEQTLEELNAWLPKMRPDGVMCGHDYYLHLPRVAHIAGQWRHEGPKSPVPLKDAGVFRAVNEFAALHKERFELQAVGPYDFGLFALWPRSVA